MKLDSKTDVLDHLRSMCGTEYKMQDFGDEVIFSAPTKESVRVVEVARREADAQAMKLGRDIEVTLPDYQLEEKYKAVMLGTGYWSVLMKRGSSWVEMHGGDGDRSNFIDTMKQN